MKIPPDYRAYLRTRFPAGESVVLRTSDTALATGLIFAGDRNGVLEFRLITRLRPDLPIENATVLREFGSSDNRDYELDAEPTYIPMRDCWEIRFQTDRLGDQRGARWR
jgi:hypothetical protein